MNTPSTDLFTLIKALTPNEKSFFRKKSVHSIKDKNSNYMRLFEFIDKQKNQNDSEIKDYFRKEVFVNQLTRTKNYLYQHILSSLRDYHTETSIRLKVRNLISEIEILYSKSLFEQCEKLVKKTRKLINDHELIEQQIDLFYYEHWLIHYAKTRKKTEQQIDLFFDQAIEGIDRLKRYYDVKETHAQVRKISLASHGYVHDHEIKKMEKLIKASDLTIKNTRLKRTRQAILYLTSEVSHMKGDTLDCIKIYREMNRTFDDDYFRVVNPNLHLIALNNLGHFSMITKDAEAFMRVLGQLKAFKTKNENIILLAQQFWVCLEMEYFNLNQSDNELGENYFFYQSFVNKNKNKLQVVFESEILFNLLYYDFKSSNYSRCIDYIIRLEEFEKNRLRLDLCVIAGLIELLIHLKLGNHTLVESRCKSIMGKRYLSDFMHEICKIIRRFNTTSRNRSRYVHDLESIMNRPEFKTERDKLNSKFDLSYLMNAIKIGERENKASDITLLD